MHYLEKKTIDQIKVGDKGMVLADFNGVPAGTKFEITEHYGEGVMCAWQGEEFKHAWAKDKQQEDGFGKNELMFLAFEGFPEQLKQEFLNHD